MKFKFRLEKVLGYYKTLENEAKKFLAEAQAELVELQNKLDSYYQSIVDSRISTHDSEVLGGAMSERLVQGHSFIKGTEVLIERQKVAIRKATEKVEMRLENLKQAAIQTRMIEKIKEKQMNEFKELSNKKDQKSIDEMVTMRFRNTK
jgi:flagellar FliJ protein